MDKFGEKKMKKHCYAICAYKESPYLERCVKSIVEQECEEKSEIMICTSTPNDYISGIAEKYQIKLMVNPERGDIQSDWNFAYNNCNSEYITLIHQDDLYHKRYSECLFSAIRKFDDISIYYSKYRALVTDENGEDIQNDINCRLRNFLSLPMRVPLFQKSRFWKVAILRLGNSICCSSVTYNRKILGEKDLFQSELRYSLDWDTFLTLAERKGRFFYDKHVLTYFRIHKGSTSMKCIDNDSREKEDYIMFCKMWGKTFARIIMVFYKGAYKNYKKLK